MKSYMGIDVGSVSTNIVLLDDKGDLIEKLYVRTNGQPINAVQKGLKKIEEKIKANGWDVEIAGVGTTGSGRKLAAVIVGADVVKNEITAHAVAAMNAVPEVQTVIEIGGQDSKIIIIRNRVVADFAMNTVCAAGTGSFLDQQAARLSLTIEKFSRMALNAQTPVRIAGRCSVFAESDMIHKQQMGHNLPDIIAGLCDALVRNHLNNVGKGKEILSPIVFQGGVAANEGMREAFRKALDAEIIIPENFEVMGAIGAALLAREKMLQNKDIKTAFKGFSTINCDLKVRGFECSECPNLCEVVEIYENLQILARWGDRCGKWTEGIQEQKNVNFN
ncbi:MAG TPA: 2-hydroxyglutaryl-CoA dehydratase [Peptococcaceae bacterium]|nr:MAG: CoA-substrate-specific enzyme activase [Clostridia bacterium 41_269]HBT20484.1 2-hydroxyglutaryl-CoA dehydratase [Peptococcaceae bacterium]